MRPRPESRPPLARCLVIASPWDGVHATHIESDRRFGRHWHSTFGVGVLEEGAQRSASGRGRVDAHAGELITTNPGEVHDGEPLGGPSRRWRMVYLAPDVMEAMAAHGASSSAAAAVELVRPVVQDIGLRHALHLLFDRLDEWRAAGTAAAAEALACEESLVQACTLLLDRHSTALPQREAAADMACVRDRLADEFADPPTLADLAGMTGLSRFQLLRRFEKCYGVPPHAWLLLQRAERARASIGRGSSLADAAASSGFADQSHMTRIFVRQFGFTPGAWQRALQ